MSTLGGSALTLVDFAKRIDPDGKVAAIAELLSLSNPILQDMPFIEGNLPTGHRMTVRSSLPTVAWRMLNEGVAPSKSTTAQIQESIGMLESWSEVDQALAELNGNSAAFRLSEARAFLEAMSQEQAATTFYGDVSTAPEEFTGLAPRYNSLSGNISDNVISGGGSDSDLSSIWLVCWSPETVFGIFPKGSQAGIQHEDLGLVTVETTAGIAGSRMRAYQDHWKLSVGLAVKDYRYAVRVCNLDISALSSKTSSPDLFDLMIKAIHRIPNLAMGRPVFYMNRTCFQMLDIQGRDDVVSGGQLGYENVAGKIQYSFRGIPVRMTDALTETESAIT